MQFSVFIHRQPCPAGAKQADCCCIEFFLEVLKAAEVTFDGFRQFPGGFALRRLGSTAYDQYAIRAFSVNSIDYILKPVDEQRLSDAIAKYETLHGQAWLKSEKYMETLLETLKHPEKKYRSRFLISGTDEFWLLRVEDIAYFYSEEKTTFAVTPSGREHILDLSLNKLEEQLDPEQFFRVNRQMILNVDAIDRAAPFFKGRIKVVVHPPFKSDIIISEGKASAFRLWLNY